MIKYFVLFNILCFSMLSVAQNTNIIPVPSSVEMLEGTFTLSKSTRVDASEHSKLANYLKSQIKIIVGLDLNLDKGSNNSTTKIQIKTDSNLGIDDEAYVLTISPNQIEIVGKTEKGLFYGIQSLIQILPVQKDKSYQLPCQKISDTPRFGWRGMLLDVSRHYFPKESILKFIDLLALHKLNVFHWHLTDDQGWRIEIKKYPKLTSVGAWREDRRGEKWNIDDEQRNPYPTNKPFYGGYYTQDDIREIVRYAADRNIQIIPEIEMPGHSRAALVAYPEFSCFGYETKVPSGGYVGANWDFSDPYCAGNNNTFTFIQNILDEVISLFPSQYIHVGGDECSKRIWKICPKCQQRIKDEHLKDEFELQSYFIKRIEKYINSKGKRMIGWQEILEGGMNPSAIIMPWRGEDALETAIHAAKSGHQLIMAPSSHLYFNRPWEIDTDESSLDLKTTYLFEPIPTGLDLALATSINGVEGCLWTELTPEFTDVEYQTMPRIAALSELVWSTKENKSWNDFKSRLAKQKQLYKHLNINYYVPAPETKHDKIIFVDKINVSFENTEESAIRFTTNGNEPNSKSRKFTKPFSIKASKTLRIAAFDKFGHKSKTKTIAFEKQNYRESVILSNLKKGLNYQLYAGKIRGTEQIEMATPTTKGNIDSIAIVDRNGNENGGMILNGYIQIPSKGIYTFYLASDDGSKLYIGDYCVVSNEGYTSALQRNGEWIFQSGKIALESGLHPITIRYFDWGGGENLKVQIEGSGMEKQDISTSILFSTASFAKQLPLKSCIINKNSFLQ